MGTDTDLSTVVLPSRLPGIESLPAHSAAPVRVRVLVSGVVGISAQTDAASAIESAFIDAGVADAEVRLRLSWYPAEQSPLAVAQVNANVDGHHIRAQVSAIDPTEVVTLLSKRVHAQLEACGRQWPARVGPQFKQGWPERSTRAAGNRSLVRVKTYALEPLTVTEAMRRMDAMDYNFYLYASSDYGQSCMIYRIGPTGYRVSTPNPQGGRPAGLVPPLTLQSHAAAQMDIDDAIEHLNRTDFPFVLFYDADIARVMYRRYDGHYGVVSAGAR